MFDLELMFSLIKTVGLEWRLCWDEGGSTIRKIRVKSIIDYINIFEYFLGDWPGVNFQGYDVTKAEKSPVFLRLLV